MASVVYPIGKQNFLSGAIDLTTDNIKVVCVDAADYTYSAAHNALDDVAVAARVGTSGNLASKTVTDGVFDAADITITSVTGDQFEALVLYKDTGVESTSLLIAYIDTGTGLPFTPSGGDITITWDSGANRIFAL